MVRDLTSLWRRQAPAGGLAPHRRGSQWRALLACLALALCAALLTAAPSLADTPVLDTTFDGGPSHTLSNPGRLAADDATGDVYVLDLGNDEVVRYTSNGAFVDALSGADVAGGTFGFGGEDDIAVDNSGGATQGYVYVASELGSNVVAYDAAGNLIWQGMPAGFSDVCGVAVDASGQLWASDFSGGVQQLSTADGSPIGSPVVTTGDTCHIAFDASGDLYLNHWNGGVDKYAAPDYTTSSQIESFVASDVATDFVTGDVYTNLTGQIDAFDSSGTAISGTPFDIGGPLGGVTVAGAFGNIFVSDQANAQIQVFNRVGGPAPKPTARTGDADVLTLTTARVNGRTNPNGTATTCVVEYGTAPDALDSTASCSAAAGSGTTETAVSASLSGLTAHTTYYYRLVTSSTAGTTNGSVFSFTTEVAPTPVATSASSLAQTGGTLNGTVNPNGLTVTDCHFEYGTTTAYGSTIPCSSLPGSGTSAVNVSAAIAGLSANTPYHFRLVARTTAGTGTSSDATFTTPPNAPAVTTGDATGISTTGATLGGSVNAQGADTTCVIEYGPTTSYGSSAPCSPTPTGSSAVAVSAAISGLTPGTQYHYRVSARNAGGSASGADKTFTTTTTTSNATLSLLGSHKLTVKGGRVALKLSCTGDAGAVCSGKVTLTTTYKVKKRKKTTTKTATIGSASVSIATSSTETVKVKLSALGKRLLAKSRRHKISAALTGPNGLDETVTLKLKVVKKKHKHHR